MRTKRWCAPPLPLLLLLPSSVLSAAPLLLLLLPPEEQEEDEKRREAPNEGQTGWLVCSLLSVWTAYLAAFNPLENFLVCLASERRIATQKDVENDPT